jgi:hypothetical protein
MSYDNMSSVSQNVLKFYQQLTGEERRIPQTDGHGESSIPPYNFVAGGIIINFPNMCSNIPASPAYGVYISQLIRYARASSNKMNCELKLTYDTPALWQTGSRII